MLCTVKTCTQVLTVAEYFIRRLKHYGYYKYAILFIGVYFYCDKYSSLLLNTIFPTSK